MSSITPSGTARSNYWPLQADWLITTLAWCVTAAVFFRHSVFTGLDFVVGSAGDARLVLSLHEHWLHVISGSVPFTAPPMLYPTPNTLGFSDGMLLGALFFVPFRLVGADPFLAFQLTLMTLSAVGYFAFVALVRRLSPLPLWIALAGATIFMFSNMNAIKTGQPQHMAVAFVPLIALLAVGALQQFGKARANRLAAAAGLLLALLFSTAFYVAWLLALFLIVFVPIWGVVDIRRIADTLRHRTGQVIACIGSAAAGFIAGLLPFAVIYLPVILRGVSRGYEDGHSRLGTLWDLINVGPENWLWSDIVARTPHFPLERLGNGELSLALTPIVLLLLTIGGGLLLSRGIGRLSASGRLALALMLASAVSVLLVTRFDDLTAWRLVYELVPGATAIRSPYRLLLIVGFTAALALTLMAGNAWQSPRGRIPIAVLLGLSVIEQFNIASLANIHRPSEVARLDALYPPPPACRQFLAINPTDNGRPPEADQIDAILIAQRTGLPTVNGYSGWWPDHWRLFEMRSPTYADAAGQWLRRYDLLDSSCAYDLSRKVWTALPFTTAAERLVPGEMVLFSDRGTGNTYTIGGWHDPEPWGRWTSGEHTAIRFQVGSEMPAPLLTIAFTPFSIDRHEQPVEFSLDGIVLNADRLSSQTEVVKTLALPPLQPGVSYRLSIRTPRAISPAGLTDSEDRRSLGIGVAWLRLERGDSEHAAPPQ